MGLTPEAIEAYHTLVEHGPLTASELRQQVPGTLKKDKAAQILKDLARHGAITKADGHKAGEHAKYDAVHPRELLDAKMSSLSIQKDSDLPAMEQLYEARSFSKSLSDKAVISAPGVQAEITAALAATKKRFLVHDCNLKWLNTSELEKACAMKQKAVDVQFLSDWKKAAKRLHLHAKSVPVRTCKASVLSYVVADDIVIVIQPDGRSAVVSQNPGLAECLASHFAAEFKAAKKEE